MVTFRRGREKNQEWLQENQWCVLQQYVSNISLGNGEKQSFGYTIHRY